MKSKSISMAGKITKFASLLFVLALSSLNSACFAADAVAKPVSRIARLQVILGIANSDADLLTSLAAAIKEFGGPGQDQAIQALADALNHGASPTALSGPYLARIPANTIFVDDKTWPYGQWSDIYRISNYLFDQAKLNAEKDPKKAARMARAAALLLAHEDFRACVFLPKLCKDADFIRIAQFDPQATDELKQFIADEEAKSKSMMSNNLLVHAMQSLDVMISSYPAPIRQTDLDAAIKAYEALFNVVSDHPEDQNTISMGLSEITALLRA